MCSQYIWIINSQVDSSYNYKLTFELKNLKLNYLKLRMMSSDKSTWGLKQTLRS